MIYTLPHRTIMVHEKPNPPIDTGLLDAEGAKIFRYVLPETIGFVDFEEIRHEKTKTEE